MPQVSKLKEKKKKSMLFGPSRNELSSGVYTNIITIENVKLYPLNPPDPRIKFHGFIQQFGVTPWR